MTLQKKKAFYDRENCFQWAENCRKYYLRRFLQQFSVVIFGGVVFVLRDGFEPSLIVPPVAISDK